MADETTNSIAMTDPALTSALGLPENQYGASIVPRIAPEVEVYNRYFKARQFGKDRYRKQVKVSRPRGGDAERISRSLKDPKNFEVEEKTLKDVIDRRDLDEARNAPDGGFDLRLQTTLDLDGNLETTIEAGVSDLVLTHGNYGASNKSNTAADVFAGTNGADLLDSVMGAQNVIIKTWAVLPRVLILTPDAFKDVVTKNAAVKDQLKHTNPDTVTEAMLARYLQLEEVIVPRTVWFNAQDVGDFVWTGKKGVLFYRNPKPGLNGPSFLKTFFRMINKKRKEVRSGFDMAGNEHLYVAKEEETALVFADSGFIWY